MGEDWGQIAGLGIANRFCGSKIDAERVTTRPEDVRNTNPITRDCMGANCEPGATRRKESMPEEKKDPNSQAATTATTSGGDQRPPPTAPVADDHQAQVCTECKALLSD